MGYSVSKKPFDLRSFLDEKHVRRTGVPWPRRTGGFTPSQPEATGDAVEEKPDLSKAEGADN
jgi:hypothetical protein